MMKAGAIKALLVDRVGNEGSGAPAADIADGGLDRPQDRRRIVGVRPTRLSTNPDADRYDRERIAEDRRCSSRLIDWPNRHWPAEPPDQ